MYVQYAHDDITNFEVCGLFTDKNIESKTFFFFFFQIKTKITKNIDKKKYINLFENF